VAQCREYTEQLQALTAAHSGGGVLDAKVRAWAERPGQCTSPRQQGGAGVPVARLTPGAHCLARRSLWSRSCGRQSRCGRPSAWPTRCEHAPGSPPRPSLDAGHSPHPGPGRDARRLSGDTAATEAPRQRRRWASAVVPRGLPPIWPTWQRGEPAWPPRSSAGPDIYTCNVLFIQALCNERFVLCASRASAAETAQDYPCALLRFPWALAACRQSHAMMSQLLTTAAASNCGLVASSL